MNRILTALALLLVLSEPAVAQQSGGGIVNFGARGCPSAALTSTGDIATITASGCFQDSGISSTAIPASSLSLGQLTNSLGGDVNLSNPCSFFDGPSVAQGTTGTWFASGSVVLTDTAGVASYFCKLWDGTTVIASGAATSPNANQFASISLSGYLASPASNIKISCKDGTATTGVMKFNASGASADSTVSVFRIK